MTEQNWQDLTDEEIATDIAAQLAQPDPDAALPVGVPDLIARLAANGWTELDTLVASPPEGAPPWSVMEWAGFALEAIMLTTQGRARGVEFSQQLAEIVAPGLPLRTALAAMKRGAKQAAARARHAAPAAVLHSLAFENYEPAADPLPLGEIAECVAANYEAWLDAPAEYIDVMVLWAFGTWGLQPGCSIQEAGTRGGPIFFPMLWFTSVDPNSGKTTALRSLECAARRPLPVQRISSSALFRTIEAVQPTLLIDEIGRFMIGDPEREGLLDVACQRDGCVLASEKVGTGSGGETFVPRRYRVFGPIVLCGLGSVPPTIRSRSIRLRMKPAEADRQSVLLTTHARELAELAAWAGPHLAAHATAICEKLTKGPEAPLPPSLVNRDADIWSPLQAMAELLGGEWPQRCRQACQSLVQLRHDSATSDTRELLNALQAYQQQRAADYAATASGTSKGHSGLGILGHRSPATFDPHVPLEKVPVVDFHSWLGTADAAEFAAASAGFGGKPLSLAKISKMLAECDVFSRPFDITREGRRRQLQVYDLAALARAWGERRVVP